MMLTLTGCRGGIPLNKIDDPQRGLVIGYIDMSEAPVGADWVTVKQMLPKTDKPYWGTAIWDHPTRKKGYIFYHALPFGSYELDSFGGNTGFWRRFFTNVVSMSYQMPTTGSNPTQTRIKNKKVYYMGSYKHHESKDSSFFSPKFDLETLKSPTEKELLEIILPQTTNSQWEGVAKSRLSELK